MRERKKEQNLNRVSYHNPSTFQSSSQNHEYRPSMYRVTQKPNPNLPVAPSTTEHCTAAGPLWLTPQSLLPA